MSMSRSSTSLSNASNIKVMKYGRMARRSIVFIKLFKNGIFCGHDTNLVTYSNENHAMQTASTTASVGLSDMSPFSFTRKAGRVLRQSAIVDSTTKNVDRKETT